MPLPFRLISINSQAVLPKLELGNEEIYWFRRLRRVA
jgi:hypothetical protein